MILQKHGSGSQHRHSSIDLGMIARPADSYWPEGVKMMFDCLFSLP
jgi:hypothetical protein